MSTYIYRVDPASVRPTACTPLPLELIAVEDPVHLAVVDVPDGVTYAEVLVALANSVQYCQPDCRPVYRWADVKGRGKVCRSVDYHDPGTMTPEQYRATRERLGLTQYDLAHIIQTTITTISRRENGVMPITVRAQREIERAEAAIGKTPEEAITHPGLIGTVAMLCERVIAQREAQS